MIYRKEIREIARRQVRKHYMMMVLLCSIMIFFGTEYRTILSRTQNLYNVLEGRGTEISVDGDLGIGRNTPIGKMYDDLIRDRVKQGLEESARRLRRFREAANLDSALGRQKGILAAIVNSVESGQIYVTLQLALHQLLRSERVEAAILILAGFLINASIFIFLRNVFGAIIRRAVLEMRTYRIFPSSHLFFIYQVHRWGRVALTMFASYLFQFLWSLTLVGGVIKHYSYLMVPFIAAENPDISPKDAIRLSRKMMNGHKWDCFLLDLSFIGWHLLGILTFGFSDVFWGVPYHLSAMTEVYARLRADAKKENLPGAQALNDDLLYTPASHDSLKPVYPEMIRYGKYLNQDLIPLTPVQSFFARHFGIWIGFTEDRVIYSRQTELRTHTRIIRLELSGAAYPQRMHPLFNAMTFHLTRRVSILTPYTIWSLITIFFFFCFIGWLWEITHHLITYGYFVNRGALHGPWLPIYGSGIVMILVLLYPLRKKPALEALGIILLCGFVEYMTSYLLELEYGKRWWDYTGYFLNLNGRICGEGLFAFCVGGMISVYLLVPLLDAVIMRIPKKILIALSLILTLLFIADIIYSRYVPNIGVGITDDLETSAPESDDTVLLSPEEKQPLNETGKLPNTASGLNQ